MCVQSIKGLKVLAEELVCWNRSRKAAINSGVWEDRSSIEVQALEFGVLDLPVSCSLIHCVSA